jgi:aldose 1-epimerase
MSMEDREQGFDESDALVGINGPWAFSLHRKVTYELRGGGLTVRLGARNTGRNALPFGLGLDPWLPRTPQTLLMAKSERITHENRDHLPAGDVDIRAREDWNFVTPRKLPGAWINNAFLEWNGFARTIWPDRGISLDVFAEPPLPTFDADFFCFEPVTHPVDAQNLPGAAEAKGLIILKSWQEASIAYRFAPRWS